MRGAGKAGPAAALAAALLLAACATAPLAVLEPRPSPGLDRSTWVLRWQEEFDGTELDPANWAYLPGSAGAGEGRPVKGTVRLDGEGHLLLSTRLRAGLVETAAIGGRGGLLQGYGYVECRLRTPDSDLAHLALRLHFAEGPATAAAAGPGAASAPQPSRGAAYADILVAEKPVEGLGRQDFSGAGGRGKRLIRVPDMAEAFHSYGLAWSPSGLLFYVDGVETLRISAAISAGLASVELAMESDRRELAEIRTRPGFHADCLVDYVRVYSPLGALP